MLPCFVAHLLAFGRGVSDLGLGARIVEVGVWEGWVLVVDDAKVKEV